MGALVPRALAAGRGETDGRIAVQNRLHSAMVVLRVVLTLNLLGLTWWRWDNFDHQGWAAVAILAIVVWTVVVLVLYADPSRRRAPLFIADMAVALATMASSPWIKGEDFNATVPGFWVMGPLLVWTTHWYARGGLAAGLILASVDLVIRDEITQTNYGNVFLLILGGGVLGYMCGSLVQMAAERSEAERRAAVEQERTRLARAVHDGVLQVLALVQRRGAEAEGAAVLSQDQARQFAELGHLAAEQEQVLRALIQAQDSVATLRQADGGRTSEAPRGHGSDLDLTALLEALASARVTVVSPGEPTVVAAETAIEMRDAVVACLDNVRWHVGEEAPAWVLVEKFTDHLLVTVRDEGPGIEPGRLEAAAAEGRLGVACSIRGRLNDIGGTASVETGSWGTEWELRLPLP